MAENLQRSIAPFVALSGLGDPSALRRRSVVVASFLLHSLFVPFPFFLPFRVEKRTFCHGLKMGEGLDLHRQFGEFVAVQQCVAAATGSE